MLIAGDDLETLARGEFLLERDGRLAIPFGNIIITSTTVIYLYINIHNIKREYFGRRCPRLAAASFRLLAVL